MKVGYAPCVGCNLFCYNIKLTGKNEPADDGGTWWEVAPNQFCINCGEPWNWLCEPAPEQLWLGQIIQELKQLEQQVNEEINLG